MYARFQSGAFRVLVIFFLVSMLGVGSCGGSDSSGGGGPTFFLVAINPSVSNDLNGGDTVTITGGGFAAVGVASVLFNGRPAITVSVDSDSQLTVVTPAPNNGLAQFADVEVVSLLGGSKFLLLGYEYVAPPLGPPDPQTITPVTFGATGAEDFTVQGNNLGPANGTALVTFGSAGTALANVNADGTVLTGRMPVVPGTPPVGNITVSVNNGSESRDVPGGAAFDWIPPASVQIARQVAGRASTPVRLADDFAIVCSGGANNFGDADDAITIIQRTPGAITTTAVTRVGGIPVGFLNGTLSIPAVLDENTFCVYSLGPDGTINTLDDTVVLVTAAQTAPVVSDFVRSNLNTAPLAAIASNRVAYTTAGPNGTLGDPDDELEVLEFTGTNAILRTLTNLGPVATTGTYSVPFSPDGEALYVMTTGPDGVARNGDDRLVRASAATLPTGTSSVGAPWMVGPPIAFSGTLLAGPGGAGAAPGVANDVLAVFSDTTGSLVRTGHPLNQPVSIGAITVYARVGDGIAVATGGTDNVAGNAVDEIHIFGDPTVNAPDVLFSTAFPLFSPLGSGDLVYSQFGPNLVPGGGDDRSLIVFGADRSTGNFVNVAVWRQNVAPRADADRSFAVGLGIDGAAATGDEELIVLQSRAVGQPVNASLLPLVNAPPNVAFRVTGLEPFVPIGPRWGLIQSPGPDNVYTSADDRILVVRY